MLTRPVFLFACLSFPLLIACSDSETALRKRIAGGVDAIRIIDTHEHLPPEKRRSGRELSLFTTLHYTVSDMWADGLERRQADSVFSDPAVPLEAKWALFSPYWANTRNTAYSRNLLRAVKDLYGIDRIDESTYRELSRKINEARQPGWYAEVLKKRAGIDLAICDGGLGVREMDPAFFRGVFRLDDFLLVWNSFGSVEKNWGVEAKTLADWENVLQKAFQQVKDWGYVGIKSGIAYNRTLSFEPVERLAAEKIFSRLAAEPGLADSLSFQEKKPLQDYMFEKLAELCARYDLPFQIHTGLFYDTWRDISQADPSKLAAFILRHRGTRFVLMHCGYPYGRELLALAKNLPNVTLDMCWIYIISPRFAADFLDEAIETVPRDKILGFGGDFVIPEGTYAHAMLCREVVSRVLADKVLSGYWGEEEALAYARAILRDNPIKVFKLEL